MDVLYGLHPVEEAIRARAGALDRVSIAKEARDGRLEHLVQACRDAGIRVAVEPREQLTRYANTDAHQGVVGFIRERKFLTLEDLLETPKPEGQYRFFLALDGIEDPHNLGALLRTADGAGVDGVILTERRAAPGQCHRGEDLGRSDRACAHRQSDQSRARTGEAEGEYVWCIGLDERGEKSYDEFDFKADCVLVLGREGEGLHDLTRKTCDHLLRIPMAGGVSSLNVSVAGAVVMYEAARSGAMYLRQRRRSLPGPRKGLGS